MDWEENLVVHQWDMMLNLMPIQSVSPPLGCTIRILPGSALHTLSTFSPLFASEGLYPPIPLISFTFGQTFYGGSTVKCRSLCGSKCSEDDK